MKSFLKIFFLFTFYALVPIIPSFAERNLTCNLSKENPFFVGREEQLQEIESFFKKGDQVLALTGGPGFGKTQIAKHYAQQVSSKYDVIWWIDAQQDIPYQYERLALVLNKSLPQEDRIIPSQLSKDALIDVVKHFLKTPGLRYLLIFDNADDYNSLEKFLPPTHNQSGKHVLLTSRNANVWPEKVEIGKFKRQESLSLIKGALPKEKPNDAETLADTLSDYPLDLTISIAFIKAHPTTTINKYVTLHLKGNEKQAGKTSSPLLNTYTKDTQTTLGISLKAIEESAPDALKALYFMSLLNSKDIPDSYIDLWLQNTKSTLTSAEAIKLMYDQSLVDVRRVPGDGEKLVHFLSLHDLIHQRINEVIAKEEKKQLIDTAVDVMLEVFAGPADIYTKRLNEEPVHLLHAKKLLENARVMGYLSPQLLKLKNCIFQYLVTGIRDFETAKKFLVDIAADFKAGHLLDPYEQALFVTNRGFLKGVGAHYPEAIQDLKEGLALFESLEGCQNEMLKTIANLMQAHIWYGEPEKAQGLIPQGKSLLQQATSVVQRCFFLYAKALTLADQGQFQRAEEILKKVDAYFTVREERPPLDHIILQLKAAVFIKQGKLDEALKVIKECADKTAKFYHGRSNMALSHSLLLKSLAYIKKGNVLPQLFQDLNKALSIYNDYFKGERKQRFQARTYFAIGKAYAFQRDFKKALAHFMISDEIYNKSLVTKSIDDVSELYTALAILGKEMQDEELTHKYLNEHIQTFGLAHPRTQEVMLYLIKEGCSIPF